MDNMTYKQANEIANDYNDYLLATDERFSNVVRINHHDGSSFTYTHSFLIYITDEWLAVFTEHHGYKVYNTGDLTFFAQYKRVNTIEKLNE